jgi:hypothetical protein
VTDIPTKYFGTASLHVGLYRFFWWVLYDAVHRDLYQIYLDVMISLAFGIFLLRTLINVTSDHQEKNPERQRHHHVQINLIEIAMDGIIKDPPKEPIETNVKRSRTEIFRRNIGHLRKIQWFAHQFNSTRMMGNR